MQQCEQETQQHVQAATHASPFDDPLSEKYWTALNEIELFLETLSDRETN